MNNIFIIHGVFLDIYNLGVLITGPSNIGKSELALSLIKRTHRLIADDAVSLKKEHNIIIGSCPAHTEGFLAIRDLGLINVIKLFGEQSFIPCKKLELIIKLSLEHTSPTTAIETHLQSVVTMQNLLDISLPQYTILIKPNRNLADLVETTVRLYQLKQTGYDAYIDFTNKQSAVVNLP